MSGTWRIGPVLALAQLQAAITRADAGAGASRIRLFTSDRPAELGGDPGAETQADIVLAKPCGAVVDGVLVLYVADSGGTMVMLSGIPRWGHWLAGSGQILAEGSVTDPLHGGDFRVVGGATPDGDDSPMLYAGGLVLLGATALT